MDKRENPRLHAAHHVSAQVDAKDGDSSQRKRNAGNDEEEKGGDLWDVAGQCVCYGLLQVVKDEATCSHQKHMEQKKGSLYYICKI